MSNDNASAIVRRQTISQELKEGKSAIAFLNAEEKLLELRLARRKSGSSRYASEAREAMRERKEAILTAYAGTSQSIRAHRPKIHIQTA